MIFLLLLAPVPEPVQVVPIWRVEYVGRGDEWDQPINIYYKGELFIEKVKVNHSMARASEEGVKALNRHKYDTENIRRLMVTSNPDRDGVFNFAAVLEWNLSKAKLSAPYADRDPLIMIIGANKHVIEVIPPGVIR